MTRDSDGQSTPIMKTTLISPARTQATRTPRPPEPTAIAITPNGKAAYAVNSFSNTVIPINTGTNEADRAIPAGKGPAAIAITP
jgi:hyaluronoglucosaminidase